MPIRIDKLVVNFTSPTGKANKKAKSAGGSPAACVPLALATGGVPLGMKAQRFAEGVFGRRFDDVRIHADAGASERARELDAHAFTLANHIYFDFGKFDPDSRAGQALLAHELTHVAQQGGGGKGDGQAKSKAPSPAGAEGAERQAEAVEKAVLNDRPVPVSIGQLSPGPMILRKAKQPWMGRSGLTGGLTARAGHEERTHATFFADRGVRIGGGARARLLAANPGSVLPARPPAPMLREYDVVGFTEVAFGAISRAWGQETGPDGCYTTTSTVCEKGGGHYDLIRVWALSRRGPGVFRPRPADLLRGISGPIGLTVLTAPMTPRSTSPLLAKEAERSVSEGRRRVRKVAEIFNEVLTEKLNHAAEFDEGEPEGAPLPEFAIEHRFAVQRPQKTGGGGFLGGILGALKAGLAFAAKLFGMTGGSEFAGQSQAAIAKGGGLANAIEDAVDGVKGGGLKGGAAKAAKQMGQLFASPLPGAPRIGPAHLEHEAERVERRAEAELGRRPAGPLALYAGGDGERLGGPAFEYAQKLVGRSLSDVRIHRGAEAADAAAGLQAHAFTMGKDIYFGQGEFRPETPKGMALLVHELTHVAQQGTAAGAVQPKLFGRRRPEWAGSFMAQQFAPPRPIQAEALGERFAASAATVLPGLPLEADVRAKLEDAIEADLTRVRLYTGSRAAKAAKHLDADAFAVGHAIVLGERATAELAAGRVGTVAHELEHVRQVQRGDHLGAKTPLARDILEESARQAERRMKDAGPALGIADFLRAPETVARVAAGLPDELALLKAPSKRPQPPKPEPDEKEKDDSAAEEEDDGTHVIHWAMQHFGVRPQVGEDEFLDEIAERVRDLMDEELRTERERKFVEHPY